MANLPAIQVVDNELRSQVALRRSLEGAFQLVTASNALDEAEIIRQRNWVQVLLCDQRMPEINGW